VIALTVAIILKLKIGRLIPRKIAVMKSLFLLTAYKFQFLAAAKLTAARAGRPRQACGGNSN